MTTTCRSATPDSTPRIEAEADRRLLQFSVLIAVLLHGALALVPLPAASERAQEPESSRGPIVIHPTPRFRPPDRPLPAAAVPPPIRVPVPVPVIEAPTIVREHVVNDDPMWDLTELVPAEVSPPPPPAIHDSPVRLAPSAPDLRKVHHVAPVYPESARKAGVGGTVILDVVVGRDGLVREVHVLRPAPYGLTEAALAAVGQWRYHPPLVDGRPADIVVSVTVRFELR